MKIGICGLGDRMAYLARVILDYDRHARFICYADPAPAGLPMLERDGLAAGLGYRDLQAMLDRHAEELDLLMIGSPNHLHFRQIELCLAAGVRVFAEKPVVTTLEDSFKVAALLHEYGDDRIIVGLVLRYSPLYRKLVSICDEDMLGALSSIEASEHIAPAHGAFFMRDWRRHSQYSGGFMLEKCCHDLDLYQGLVGARPHRVASFGGRRTFLPEHAELENPEVHHKMASHWGGTDAVFTSDGDIIDNQVALIEYQNGVNLCFHSNLNVADHFRRFCAVGAKATAEGDFERGFLHVDCAATGRRLVEEKYAITNPQGHYGSEERMVADIWTHLRDGGALPVSASDALIAGMTALCIDEARKSGKVIDCQRFWERFDVAHGQSGRSGDAELPRC